MRTKNGVAAVLLIVLFAVSFSHQARAQGQEAEITGTVVDVYCLVTMNMEGKAHRQCAMECVKNGAPLGIKEEKTGAIYLVAGQKKMVYASSQLEKYVEQRVTARGTVYERGGVKMLVVDSAKPVK